MYAPSTTTDCWAYELRTPNAAFAYPKPLSSGFCVSFAKLSAPWKGVAPAVPSCCAL